MDTELETLSADTGRWLAERGWMLATAESCTGGWVAATVTITAGSSGWFDRGFVTYSNDAKEASLDVQAETLSRHGAVSEAVVVEMVAGALAHSMADLALAVSGVAGPGGGSPAKPVGTVCLAWGRRGQPATAVTCHFPGDRTAVRRAAVIHALHGLRQHCG